MKPYIGMEFRHKRLRRFVRGEGNRPMVCRVTHMNDTTVYYVDEDGRRRGTDFLCFSSVVDAETIPTGFGGLAFSDSGN